MSHTPSAELTAPRRIEQTIGQTPLVRIQHLASHVAKVEIYAKAEWLNPGGSVKDRPALAMLDAGLADGSLTEGKTILEATSGNTGIALAMIGAARGFPMKICLPENANAERKRALSAYGAEIIETSRLEGTDGAIQQATKLYSEDPDAYFYPDQYNNENNWLSHYQTTAPEIWSQTEGRIDLFVCGLGTTGTFVGTTRRLKELNPNISGIAVQPAEPLHGIEGWKHLPTSLVPGIYDETLADEHLKVETEKARHMARRLAKDEGLFVGVSSGAAMCAALELAERMSQGVIVTVFPDGGGRSLSDMEHS